MPFGGTSSDVSLQNLSAILRDQTRWPVGFVWSYTACEMCAMGLAWKLGHAEWATVGAISHAYDVPHECLFPIFFGNYWGRAKSPSFVTPTHVADAIDAYLATVADKVEA